MINKQIIPLLDEMSRRGIIFSGRILRSVSPIILFLFKSPPVVVTLTTEPAEWDDSSIIKVRRRRSVKKCVWTMKGEGF